MNFFTAKYVKIVTMSKIFKYIKKIKIMCFYVKICIYLKVRALLITMLIKMFLSLKLKQITSNIPTSVKVVITKISFMIQCLHIHDQLRHELDTRHLLTFVSQNLNIYIFFFNFLNHSGILICCYYFYTFLFNISVDKFFNLSQESRYELLSFHKSIQTTTLFRLQYHVATQ